MLRTAALIAAMLATSVAICGEIPLAERRSTYEDMSAETRAMQDVDTDNPGMLWVLDGEAQWQAKAGKAAVACAGCHGEAARSMKGVAARYPAYDRSRGTAIDLAGRINLCRAEHQEAPELKRESKDLLALTGCLGALALFRRSRMVPALICFGAAVASKESALPLPVALLFWDRWLERREWRDAARRAAPFAAVAFVWVLVSMLMRARHAAAAPLDLSLPALAAEDDPFAERLPAGHARETRARACRRATRCAPPSLRHRPAHGRCRSPGRPRRRPPSDTTTSAIPSAGHDSGSGLAG